MGVMEIISALAALAAIASSIYGGVKSSEAQGAANAYAQKEQRYREDEIQRRNAQARRAAMESALAGKPSKAFQSKMPPAAPRPYDPAVANTIGAVAGGVQQLANADWSGVSNAVSGWEYPWNRKQEIPNAGANAATNFPQ